MPQLEQAEFDINSIELNANGFKNSRTIMGDLTEMKESIVKNDLLNPPIVYETTDDTGQTRYILLAGYRRHAAITERRQELIDEHGSTDGWFDTIQCSVFKGSFEEAIALNISENLQREDLNYADKAEAIARLVDRVGNQTAVAEMLSVSQPQISQMCKVYNGLASEALEALRLGRIPLQFAKELAKIRLDDGSPNIIRQVEILEDRLADSSSEVPEEEKVKRPPTFRSKKEFEELRQLVLLNEDLSVDREHRASLLQFLDWAMMALDSEQMLFRVDSYLDNQSNSEDSEVSEDVAPKRRIRMNQ